MPDPHTFHGTTIIAVKQGAKLAIGGDGQVTHGSVVLKATAQKIRKMRNGNVLTGFAASWSSTNLAVAMVDGSGLVTALAAGLATITATGGGKSGTAAITVTAPVPEPVAAEMT